MRVNKKNVIISHTRFLSDLCLKTTGSYNRILFYRKHETKKGEDTRFPNAKGKLENEKHRKEQERGDSHITIYITQF